MIFVHAIHLACRLMSGKYLLTLEHVQTDFFLEQM